MSAPTAASPPLPLRHCYWVVPGLLLAGEHPNGPTRDKTKDRLKKLLAAGIECFVDLTKPTELLRYDTHLPFYVEYTRKAIKDHGIPGSSAQMTEILDHIANSMRAGRPVYVHCRAGIGRTGTVVGCLLVERGLQGNAAIDELNRLWQQCRRSKSWAFIPETDAQASYIRDWKPALETGGFELSSLATAVATVGPMTTAGSIRPDVLSVADVQARAASQATGAGQARAAIENLAAGKGRGGAGASTASAGYASGAGLSAAAEQARAAVARGDGRGGPGKGAPVPGASSSGAQASSTAVGAKPSSTATEVRGDGRRKGASVPGAIGGGAQAGSAAVARGDGRGKDAPVSGASSDGAPASSAPVAARGDGRGTGASVSGGAVSGGAQAGLAAVGANASSTALGPWGEFEKGEISPSIRAEIADAIAGRSTPGKAGNGVAAPLTRDLGNGRAAPGGSVAGTAAPNAGEEAEWAQAAPAGANGRGAGAADDRRGAGNAGTSRPGTAADARAGAPRQGAVEVRAEVSMPDAADGRADALRPDAPDRRADALRPAFDGGPPNGTAPAHARTSKPPATPEALAPQPSFTPRAPAVRAPAEPPLDPDPLLDPDTLAAARGLRERFLGTLFGLAIGDAVAAATQFRRPGSFSPIGDMIGGGPFDLPRGAWSDDTAMALCLAESLLERDGFDARDQVQRYIRWQQEGYLSSTGQCVGITASTARSLALAKWRRVVFPGSHDPEQLDPEPLSRVAPVALFYFASVETTLVQAADSSRTTCQAPAVLDACRRLGRALNAALSGQLKTKILAEAGPIPEGAAQSNNTAATALAAALWAFGSTDNYRDAVLRAANVGGNSDVVAAVCGQLAGAHYGATGIPQSWRSGLIQKDLIEGIADRLLAHGLVSLSS
ncbi:MAG: ADP-ribosyl-[dinitrogen reductase] hydrolase [Gammaproteobacteria bacterium]|nr:ADP-ribosyl-[dinitrogen reductase] hydrolase [Gammaproteobacteria bacterium]